MKKAIIIGCPGSGKSTFARKLNSITRLPLYYLDMMFWNEDKTTVSGETFLKRLEDVMSRHEWIIDGNYMSTMQKRLDKCDTVFFLDYPTDVCLDGIRRRKGQKRPDMPWVEDDSTDEEFVQFVRQFNDKTRLSVLTLLEKNHSKNIIVFSSRQESEEYLLQLEKRKLNETEL